MDQQQACKVLTLLALLVQKCKYRRLWRSVAGDPNLHMLAANPYAQMAQQQPTMAALATHVAHLDLGSDTKVRLSHEDKSHLMSFIGCPIPEPSPPNPNLAILNRMSAERRLAASIVGWQWAGQL